jgi:hypothetical protein
MENSSRFKYMAFQLHYPIAHGKFVLIKTTRGGGIENGFSNKGGGRRKDSSIGKNGHVFKQDTKHQQPYTNLKGE